MWYTFFIISWPYCCTIYLLGNVWIHHFYVVMCMQWGISPWSHTVHPFTAFVCYYTGRGSSGGDSPKCHTNWLVPSSSSNSPYLHEYLIGYLPRAPFREHFGVDSSREFLMIETSLMCNIIRHCTCNNKHPGLGRCRGSPYITCVVVSAWKILLAWIHRAVNNDSNCVVQFTPTWSSMCSI